MSVIIEKKTKIINVVTFTNNVVTFIIKIDNKTWEETKMKNVMTRAWEIARRGATKFGGKIKEYFAQSLVIAWAEIKKDLSVQEKGLKIYTDYIKNVISKGVVVVSQNGAEYTINNMGKNYVVTYEMSDLDVFAKATLGKQVKYFNLGRVA
ncbi:hypothetical protein ACTHO0_22935 [Cytobacillus praedii]|uniref:hypothetical protein n=1 Tax=Cytobacillus praedii TaxID=1742358 RepID=UPI003F807533